MLRAAGYLPVVEDADGAVQGPRRPAPPTARCRPAPASTQTPSEDAEVLGEPDVDVLLREVATALLSGTQTGPVDEHERLLRLAAPQLPTGRARLLLDAEGTDEPVVITYRSSSGRITTRAVSVLRIRGRTTVAWCYLREDERALSLEGVLEVQPAGW